MDKTLPRTPIIYEVPHVAWLPCVAWLLAEAHAEAQHVKHAIACAEELLAKAEREVRPLVRPLKVIYPYIHRNMDMYTHTHIAFSK